MRKITLKIKLKVNLKEFNNFLTNLKLKIIVESFILTIKSKSQNNNEQLYQNIVNYI